VSFDHAVERLFGDLQQDAVPGRHDVGGAWRFVEETHLSKKIARLQCCQSRFAAARCPRDLHRAIQYQVHGITQLVNPDNGLAGGCFYRFNETNKRGNLVFREVGKQFEASELAKSQAETLIGYHRVTADSIAVSAYKASRILAKTARSPQNILAPSSNWAIHGRIHLTAKVDSMVALRSEVPRRGAHTTSADIVCLCI
jgi:hypothetical protein